MHDDLFCKRGPGSAHVDRALWLEVQVSATKLRRGVHSHGEAANPHTGQPQMLRRSTKERTFIAQWIALDKEIFASEDVVAPYARYPTTPRTSPHRSAVQATGRGSHCVQSLAFMVITLIHGLYTRFRNGAFIPFHLNHYMLHFHIMIPRC